MINITKNIINKKILSVSLVIAWMAIIFIMSSFNSIDSSNQSNFIVNIIADIFNISNTEIISLTIRKLAHFTEYFILGLLMANMLKYYNRKEYIGIIICVIYAISDEMHQLFVSGRSCQILDMLIDTIGSSAGIFLYNILRKK